MKKRALLMTAVAALATVTAAGCYDGGTFSEGQYTAEGSQLNGIVISAEDREIDILPSDDGNVTIEYFESEKEFYSLTEENGVLTMKLEYNKSWTDYIGGKPDENYRKITVKLPSDGMDSIDISTTNESVYIGAISATYIAIASNGGDVEVNGISAEMISLNAKNGDIEGTVAGTYEQYSISCTIKKGESNLPGSKPEGERQLLVDCNNGDIEIKFSVN